MGIIEAACVWAIVRTLYVVIPLYFADSFNITALTPEWYAVGIGCLHADYDKYMVVDGVRVRRGTETKNWWGPINVGITLVWKIF